MSIPHKLPPRNEKFAGRQEELAELHRQLNSDAEIGITQQTAAHGHGGVGKSALAIEYAWSHFNNYPGGLFFVRGDTPAFVEEIASLALPLKLDDRDTSAKTARAVVDHLQAGPASLLILDSVDEAENWVSAVRSGFLPGGNCRRLITTRCRSLRDIRMYSIERLPSEEGILLLAKFRTDAKSTENRGVVGDIVDWFDGLAVGLTVVGAYMERHNDLGWEEYRDELNNKGLGAVRRTEDLVIDSRPLDYDKRVDSVIDDLLDSLSKAERRALMYAALLPEEQIVSGWLIDVLQADDDLMTSSPSSDRPSSPSMLARLFRFITGNRKGPLMQAAGERRIVTASQELTEPGYNDRPAEPVLSELVAAQLLRRLAEGGRIVAMHRVLRRRLNERLDLDSEFCSVLVDRICNCVESWGRRAKDALGDKELRDELTPLTLLVGQLMKRNRHRDGLVLVDLVYPTLHRLGRYHECRNLLQSTIGAIETTQPSDETALVNLYSKLGEIETELENFGDGRTALGRAISMQEGLSGQHTPPFRNLLIRLASLESSAGNTVEARKLLSRVLGRVAEEKQDAGSAQFPDISLVDLISRCIETPPEVGAFLSQITAVEDADVEEGPCEQPDEQQIAATSNDEQRTKIMREIRGILQFATAALEVRDSEDPLLGDSYYMAGLTEKALKHPQDARELFKRALTIQEQGIGPDSPIVAKICSELAVVEKELGNLEQATDLLRRSIVIWEACLGTDHSSVAADADSLGRIKAELGHIEEARILMRRAYAIRRAKLGKDHEDTQLSQEWLARFDPDYNIERETSPDG